MYSILLNSSNFGKFLGYEFYRSCISVQKKKKEAVGLIYILQKRFVRQFHFVGMQQQKELYKKHYAHAKLLFCFIIKPIASLPFSLLLLLSMLKPHISFFSLQVSVWPKSNRTFTFTSHWLLYVCLTL